MTRLKQGSGEVRLVFEKSHIDFGVWNRWTEDAGRHWGVSPKQGRMSRALAWRTWEEGVKVLPAAR